ncbi:MAG: beta-galactosidase [Limnochordia bacterium]
MQNLGGIRVFTVCCLAAILVATLIMVPSAVCAKTAVIDLDDFTVEYEVPEKVKELEYVRINYSVKGLESNEILGVIPLEQLATSAQGWRLDRGGLFTKLDGSAAQTTFNVAEAGEYWMAIKVCTGSKDDLGQINVDHSFELRINDRMVQLVAQSPANMVYWEFIRLNLDKGTNQIQLVKTGRGEVTVQEIRLYSEEPFEYGAYVGEDLVVGVGMFPGYDHIPSGFVESIEVELIVDEDVDPWTEFVFSAKVKNTGNSLWIAKGYGHVEFEIHSSGGTSDKYKLQRDLGPGESHPIGSVVKFGNLAMKALRAKPGDELETVTVDVVVHKDMTRQLVARIEVPIVRGETRSELVMGEPRVVKRSANALVSMSRQSIGWAVNMKHLANDFLVLQVPIGQSQAILGAGWDEELVTDTIYLDVDQDTWSPRSDALVATDWSIRRGEETEPVISLYHLPIRDWDLMYDIDALTENFKEIRAAGFNTIYVQIFPQWNRNRLPIVHNSLIAAQNVGLQVIPAIYFRNQSSWLEGLFPGYSIRRVGNEVDALDDSLADAIADWFDTVMADYGDIMYTTASGRIPVVVHDEYAYSGSAKRRTMGGSREDVAAFRVWLEKEYQTIEALNRAWGVDYLSFSSVDPSVCIGLDPREYPAPYQEWDTAILDWDRFRSEIFARQLGQISRELKRRRPNVITGIMPFGGDNYTIKEMWGEVDETAQRTAALGDHLRDRKLSDLDFIVFIRTPVNLIEEELTTFVRYWAEAGITPVLYGRVGGGYDAGSVSSLLPFYRLVYENGGVPGYFGWNDYPLEENCPTYQREETLRFLYEVKKTIGNK